MGGISSVSLLAAAAVSLDGLVAMVDALRLWFVLAWVRFR